MRWATDGVPPARQALELACRAGALALVAWALVASLRATDRADASPIVLRDAELAERLASLTLASDARPLHVELRAAPTPETRAWLRALARSGRPVSWSGDVGAAAIQTEPLALPGGGVRVAVAAPRGGALLLGDDVGPVDSLTPRAGGAEALLPTIEGRARLWRAGAPIASSALADSLALRAVLVLGRPSWETRFVAAALEEAGWSVALRVPVAPGQVVQQGDAALDTAHVGAVVALDSSAAPLAASIARFVRAGGGLVATASAVRGVPAIAALAPGGTGRAIAASLAEVGDAVDRRALALVAVAPLDADAVALERRDGAVALAARRVGTGRVVQVGYDETWRWRMSGGDSGVVAHRRWWSSLVAGVARAPVVRRADAGVPDPAPLAALVEALGPPRARPASSLASARFASPGAGVLAAILALLLVEWFSRRLRGAR